jgi:hypothetical protein
MSGAIPPLPQYAYMAGRSVKAQGQLYLYFYLTYHTQTLLLTIQTEVMQWYSCIMDRLWQTIPAIDLEVLVKVGTSERRFHC